jgi:hypothetical protein
MPVPQPNESEQDFVSRCTPIVMEDGTAEDNEQATAVCHSMYRQAQEAVRIDVAVTPRLIEGAQFTGKAWDVTIIGAEDGQPPLVVDGREFVVSKNGRLYAVDALRASASMWEGVKVYDNHLTDAEFEQRGGMRSVKDEWIGTLLNVQWNEGRRQLRAEFRVVDDALAAKLKSALDEGVLGSIGLSIDAFPIVGNAVLHEGRQWPVIEGFEKILSVDLVAEPAAGGRFNRIIAAKQPREKTQGAMQMAENETNENVLTKNDVAEMISAALAEALAAKDAENEPVEEAEPEPEQAPVEEAEDEPEDEADDVTEKVEAELEKLATERAQLMVDRKLMAARLNEKHEAIIRSAVNGRKVTEAFVDGLIKQAKEAQAGADPSGRVSGAGNAPSPQIVLDEHEKAAAEFLRMVAGNTRFRGLENIEDEDVAHRLHENIGYKAWVKDGKPRDGYGMRRLSDWVYQYWGDPLDASRFYEASTTSSISSIVKSALNVMLAANYATRHKWWLPIVREEEIDTIDAPTLVRAYGLDMLDVVNEGNAYTEMGWVDEEETAAFVKRGNYVGVTLEAMLRDKVQVIRTLPERLATSWYNSISYRVNQVFDGNSAAGPVLSDTGALFNSTAVTTGGGHANLLTAALTYDNYTASRTAMMKQTDQYSGAGTEKGVRMLIRPKFIVVPVDLEGTAQAIFGTEMKPGSANNDINPYYNECQVVVDPHSTDTNNWALVADPVEFPAIWVLYLRGNRVPELYSAGDESAGAMFTNDTLRWKVRQLTFRFSSTYDCSPVSDFRPLHKNNVS